VSASTTRALNLRSLPNIDIVTLPGRVARALRVSMAQADAAGQAGQQLSLESAVAEALASKS
jgi:hypothetical protein